MNRREVLRAAAAAPWIFGLGGCSRSPSWFGEALRKIRVEGKPGLVLRLPKDPELRCAFGHQLSRLSERNDVEGLSVALQAVILCMEDEDVRALIPGARDGDALLLIDGDGVAIDGLPLPYGHTIVTEGEKLLDGPKRSRLRARAAKARNAAPPEALAALEAMKGDEKAERLKPWAAQLVPLLVLVKKERDWAFNAGLESSLAFAGAGQARLPYGVELGPTATCAENPACYNGTCGACGLAVVTPRSREFVKFLAR